MAIKHPPGYSVSMLNSYHGDGGCPAKYKAKYLDHVKEEKGYAAERGDRIHALAEGYLIRRIRGLPKDLETFREEFTGLRKFDPLVEQKLAVNKEWKPVSWRGRWAGGVIDALAMVENESVIIDHKTGQIYDSHVNQAEMYACLVAANVPTAENYHVEFWYIDQEHVEDWDFSPRDIPKLRKKYDALAREMFSATRFPKTPSEKACRFCPLKKNGSCKRWKEVME